MAESILVNIARNAEVHVSAVAASVQRVLFSTLKGTKVLTAFYVPSFLSAQTVRLPRRFTKREMRRP